MILIYITCKNKAQAAKIAKLLLAKKLIACANIIKSTSLYKWKNKLKREKEHILLAKTENNKFSKIKTLVKQIHSYEIPCILKINITSNKEYTNWLKGQLK